MKAPVSRWERALALALAVLLIVVLAGTAYAVVTGSRARKLARAAVPEAAARSGVFDGLGRVRARNADGAVVIVDIAFPYDATDRQFREELMRRRGELRTDAETFFASRTADELHPSAEGAVKAALRDVFNARLSLGTIEELYFSEFGVIR